MQSYIQRKYEGELEHSLRTNPVTALLGPRQCGKSTLVRKVAREFEHTLILDLELPSDKRKLTDPEQFLRECADQLVCIDEVQLKPDLFPVLRALVDEDRRPGRFLILGSASRDLIRQSGETLAGRIHYMELTPFLFSEIESTFKQKKWDFKIHWLRGGFPLSLLPQDLNQSCQWRDDFIQTFLTRDIPQFGFAIPAPNMHRFWVMLAHYHSGLLNTSKLGQSLDVTHNTVKRYIDLLEQSFMVRVLRPLEINVKKRLVKSPKVYIRDTGLLHSLLEIETMVELYGRPIYGASWEGWCIEQIVNHLPKWRPYFYRTSSGEEIDLVMERGRKRLAFEFKASLSPKLSRGFPRTLEVLKPDSTWVVCPMTDQGYPLRDGVRVVGLRECLEQLTQLEKKVKPESVG